MSFFGRRKELRILEQAWRSSPSAFIPVYGRRRVGKSEMIVHFMGRKPGLYFVGKRAPGDAQIQELLEAASVALKEPLLAQARIGTWKGALELLLSRWKGKGKFIIALDEFQWMAEACSELPSVLQELWDRQWSKSGRIMLILCGSYLGFMEREVLGKRSPLFGRRTAQILLRPFNHLEAAEFHPRLSPADHAMIYAICGGVPAYLRTFDAGLSVEQNIITRILDDNSVLSREPEFLLREELRDLMPYHAVLMALAQNKSSPRQLALATGIDVRGLSYHLKSLCDLGYVQRRYPLTDARPSARSVRYALDDPLLRFWFRFVFPRQSMIRMLGPQRGYAELVRPEIESYYGRCFERLCREAMPMIYAREGVRANFTIGEYWDQSIQVDVVGVREDNRTDLGECKWGAGATLPAMAAELEAKVGQYPNRRNATIRRRLFVKSAAGRHKGEAAVATLEDLYALREIA